MDLFAYEWQLGQADIRPVNIYESCFLRINTIFKWRNVYIKIVCLNNCLIKDFGESRVKGVRLEICFIRENKWIHFYISSKNSIKGKVAFRSILSKRIKNL